jgi:hypothetical protein
MPGILKPELNSKKNIQEFINSIQDEKLKQVIQKHLGDILLLGTDASDRQKEDARRKFHTAVKKLVEKESRLEE